MPNDYYAALRHFEKELARYVGEIFKVYGNELMLRLEEYNLLKHEKNCLESSTALGYIMEEFIVSKLEIYTQDHTAPDYVISRTDSSTTSSSYDCCCDLGGIKVLINVKADKGGNNAVAALERLYVDYVQSDPEQTKAFLVLKIHYSVDISKRDGERKICIGTIDPYFLETVDFPLDVYKQDNRNWSRAFNPNSGRLQISKAYRDANCVSENDVSYKRTRGQIENIYKNNRKTRQP